MTPLGGIAIRVLLVTGALTTVALAIFAFIVPDEPSPIWTWRTLIGGIVLVAGVVVALSMYLRRVWSGPLADLIEQARRVMEQPDTGFAMRGGRDELAMLTHVADRMRRRWVHQRESLEQQREAVTSLIHQLHEGVVVVDARGCISLINPAAIRLLNLHAEETELRGRPVERCIPQHDLQRMLHQGRLPGAAGGSQTRAAAPPQEAQVSIELPSGNVQLLARASDLVLPQARGGAVQSRVLVLTDITELADALQMKADFVGNASHELRTPLSTIRAAVETLLGMDLANEVEDARHFLQLIDRHSGRLAEMAADLLDLSRLESPFAAHAVSRISLPSLLAELQERFADRIAEKQIQFETQLSASGGELLAAANPLQLILDNLLDNAIKFSAVGGRVVIRAALNPAGNEATFQIIDHGCGIPEADRRRVFERFYQVERARAGERRGTGLGLAIVKHATNVLGGTIALQSAVGRGTTVTVTIPSRPADEVAPAPASRFS